MISGSFGAVLEQRFERRAVDHELRPAIEEAVRQIHPARVEILDHPIDRRRSGLRAAAIALRPAAQSAFLPGRPSRESSETADRPAASASRRSPSLKKPGITRTIGFDRAHANASSIDVRCASWRMVVQVGGGSSSSRALESRDRFARRQPVERGGLAFVVLRRLSRPASATGRSACRSGGSRSPASPSARTARRSSTVMLTLASSCSSRTAAVRYAASSASLRSRKIAGRHRRAGRRPIAFVDAAAGKHIRPGHERDLVVAPDHQDLERIARAFAQHDRPSRRDERERCWRHRH